MLRINGKQKIKGLRTDCFSNFEQVIELDYYAKVGVGYRLWFYITPGITGYESFEINPDSIKRVKAGGWSACAGTKGRWDKLFIPAHEMQIALDDITSHITR